METENHGVNKQPSMSSAGPILAIAITAGLVAFCAWLARSRSLFVVGLLGAVFGAAFLAGSITAEYGPDATVRDRILGDMFYSLQGILPGALMGVALVWIAFRRANAENRRIEVQGELNRSNFPEPTNERQSTNRDAIDQSEEVKTPFPN